MNMSVASTDNNRKRKIISAKEISDGLESISNPDIVLSEGQSSQPTCEPHTSFLLFLLLILLFFIFCSTVISESADLVPPIQVPATKKSKLSARMAASFSAEHSAAAVSVSSTDPLDIQPPTIVEEVTSLTTSTASVKSRKGSRKAGNSSLACPHCGLVIGSAGALGVHISVCEMAPFVIPTVVAAVSSTDVVLDQEQTSAKTRPKGKSSKTIHSSSSSSSSSSSALFSFDDVSSDYDIVPAVVANGSESVERVVGSIMGRIVKKIEAMHGHGQGDGRGDTRGAADGRHSNRGLDQRHVYTIVEKIACIEYYDGLLAAGANVTAARIATKEHTKFPVETFRKWLTTSERNKLMKERSEEEWALAKDLKRVYPKNVRRERLVY